MKYLTNLLNYLSRILFALLVLVAAIGANVASAVTVQIDPGSNIIQTGGIGGITESGSLSGQLVVTLDATGESISFTIISLTIPPFFTVPPTTPGEIIPLDPIPYSSAGNTFSNGDVCVALVGSPCDLTNGTWDGSTLVLNRTTWDGFADGIQRQISITATVVPLPAAV